MLIWDEEPLVPFNPPLDPSVIGEAPITPDPQDFDQEESEFYIGLVGQLAAENDALRAENERLKAKRSYEEVQTSLMEPYANKVYLFLVSYCCFVGACLLLQGFSLGGFRLSDTVMAVIAGSTAVSAIGLVGFVVSGLFKANSK